MNLERTIVGLATVYGVRAQGDGVRWRAEAFEDFLKLQIGVSLRVDHGPVINARGVIADVGTARMFASVAYPRPGLLALCEVDDVEVGDSLLRDVDLILKQAWLPAGWGFSLGAHVLDEGDRALPYELSLTRSPSFADARVLGVGADAGSIWSLLTETADLIIP